MSEDNVNQQEEKRQETPPPRQPISITITDIELENLKQEAGEYKDKYQRALAESENARKRLQKERQELVQYAIQNVLVDFLLPIDQLENALKFTQSASEEVKHWATGFQMILAHFKDALSQAGAVPFDSHGKRFDPMLHEAVETIATDEMAEGMVVKETLKGYKMGERVIRPARVAVAKPLQTASQETSSNNHQSTFNQ